MNEFFSWMDEKGFAYAVLRNIAELAESFPAPGSKKDVDCLVEDRAVEPIRARYGSVARRAGVKCDFYSVRPGLGADFLGHAYYPEPLAQAVIQHRVRHDRGFFVPAAREWFDSLAFHIAYHKAEASGFSYGDPNPGQATKYFKELRGLMSQLDLDVAFSLAAFHEHLAARGYAPDVNRLVSYVQNDFAHHRKSRLFAELFNQGPGELNLFVIRGAALRQKAHLHLVRWLRRHYRFLFLKRIDWYGRLILSRRMRGNKWRRGGKPWIALVVFDPAPVPSSPVDRKAHPFVFNATQFVKRQMRDWFVGNHPVRPSINPIHSTDNEAEAIGHFPLFFSELEQARIFERLARARGKAGAVITDPAGSPRKVTR